MVQMLIDMNKLLKELRELCRWHAENAVEFSILQRAIRIVHEQPTIDIDDVPQWIPCSERLPEEPFGCLVTVWDTDPVTMDEFENILPYFVGWDGEQWNDGDGLQCPFEVIAWMPLPKPYEVKDEKTD